MVPEHPSESPGPGGPAPSREDAGTRDELARVRTTLANERTLLAYVRTALALLLAGASVLHFLGGTAAWGGALLVALGAACLGIGLARFRKAAQRIAAVGG